MTLPIDPVCGMEIVDQSAAPHSINEGDTYYFCNEGCKTKFDDEPLSYANRNPAGSGIASSPSLD